MHELLQSQITSSLLYKLLITIETVQFLWFSVHSNFAFLWKSETATIFRDAIKYLQVISGHPFHTDSLIFLV